jgi:hypothetical protein
VKRNFSGPAFGRMRGGLAHLEVKFFLTSPRRSMSVLRETRAACPKRSSITLVNRYRAFLVLHHLYLCLSIHKHKIK